MATITTTITNNKANNTNGTGTKRNRPPTVRANEPEPELKQQQAQPQIQSKDVRAEIIRQTLDNFGVAVEVAEVLVGPTVTQYRLRLGPKVKAENIARYASNLALALRVGAVGVRLPVTGTEFVGIEVQNERREVVRLEDILASEEFRRECAANELKLPFVLGKDLQGKPVVVGLEKLPHVLVAGATGAGKSVCLNSALYCLLSLKDTDDLRLVLIDPKMVELVAYNGLPELVFPVVMSMLPSLGVPASGAGGANLEPEPEPEPEPSLETGQETDALSALRWTVEEMERRYRMLSRYSRPGRIMRDIAAYNKFVTTRPQEAAELGLKKLPYIVVVIDEIADLMLEAGEEVEPLIVRLAQKARSSGIHLVLATQRPSVNVLTGLIKSNVPARIAFAVTSQTDSRVVLDRAGAEDLLGRGDMLFLNQGAPLLRVQGALISDEAINELVERKALPGVQAGVYDYTWMLRDPVTATATATASTQTAPPSVIPVPGRTRTQGNTNPPPTATTTVTAAAANTGATLTASPAPAPAPAPATTQPLPTRLDKAGNGEIAPTSLATVERQLDSLVVNTQAVHILPASAPVPPLALTEMGTQSAKDKDKERGVVTPALALAHAETAAKVAAKSGSSKDRGNGRDITSDPTSSSTTTKPTRPTPPPTPNSVVRKKATTTAAAGESKVSPSSSPKEVELEMVVEQLRLELANITNERDAALTKLSTTEQAYNLLGEAYQELTQEKEDWQKKSAAAVAAAVGTLEQTVAKKEQRITQLQAELAQLKIKPPVAASASVSAQTNTSKPQPQTTAVANVTGNVLDLLTAAERNRHKLLSQKIAKIPGQDKRVLTALVDQYELNPGTYLTIAQLANLIGVRFETLYRNAPQELIRLEIIERKQAQGHHYYRLNFPNFIRDYFPSLAGDKSSASDKAGLVRKFVSG
jgi:hypothetical protein